MTNAITKRTYVLDTTGVISKTPICLRMAIFFPNNKGDQVTFVSWDESATPDTTMVSKTVTASATDPSFTSTGNFETAEVSVGDIIKIYESDSGENLDSWLVAVRDSDDKITVDSFPTVTADAGAVYSWKIWTPYTSFKFLAQNIEEVTEVYDFGDKGYWFLNLAMDTLSSGSIVHLLIR